MGNAVLGDVDFASPSGWYKLRFDFNAVCAFDGVLAAADSAGLTSAMRIAALENGQGTASDLRGLIWAMLQRHHPEVSLLQAGDLIDEDTVGWSRAMASAMRAAAPRYEASAEKHRAALI